MTNEERQERLRAMRERLHEPLSNQTGAGATLGIKGRAGIILAELLDFLASEEPAVAIRPMESAGLAPGDVVRLASGGPAMTVVRKRPKELEEIGGWFVCAYFQESTMEQRSVTLPPAALRRVEDLVQAQRRLIAQRRLLDRVYAALEQIEPLLAGDLRHEGSRESLAALKKDIFCALAEDV